MLNTSRKKFLVLALILLKPYFVPAISSLFQTIDTIQYFIDCLTIIDFFNCIDGNKPMY